MTDARWFEIDAAVAAAVRHFAGAAAIFPRLAAAQTTNERYISEMAFMHAMQYGQTSLDTALLRILDLCAEEAPTGPRRHADLIARAAHPLEGRPAILGPEAAKAADDTRRFHRVAAHAYDQFDHIQATRAFQSAGVLVATLPADIARFRKAMDP